MLRELFLRPLLAQKRRLGGIAGALLVLSAANALFLLLVKGFIKALFTDAARPTIPLTELLPAKVFATFPRWESVVLPADALALYVPLAILAAGLLKAIADYFYELNQQAVALYVAKHYREKLFAALVLLPYVEIRKRPAGEWMSIVMNDVLLLQQRFSDMITGVVHDSVVVVACYAVLWLIHWPSALALLAISPVVAFGMGRTGKKIARFTEAFQRELARISGTVLDLRARFDFIRSQAGEERESKRFAALTLAYYRMIRKSIMVRSAFAPVLEAFGFAVFAAFVYAIGNGMWGEFSPELMMQFFVALGVLLRPLRGIGEQLTRYHETKGALADSLATFRKIAALGTGASVPNGLRSKGTGASVPNLIVHSIKAGMAGEVRFAATDLRITSGRAVAIVGPSGAGKSTLIKTLAGLVAPLEWQGTVSWDAATNLVSMVSQDPFLFDDSIAENLVYGLASDSRPRDDEIWRTLATVNIDGEMRALPERLATRMRAVGSNVSGGQLQRLVIARGLLRNKPVWLLDEATSAVDARSERDITQRLIAACHESKKALLAVTHRLTWLDSFDEVWFVENGKLALAGKHTELLADPRYRAYCATTGGGEGG